MGNDDTPDSKQDPSAGKPWSSDASTVERRDRDLPAEGTGQDQPAGENGSRPIAEEQANQASLPTRGDQA